MDPLQIRNPSTDQNRTQHNSLRSGELFKSKNSSSVDPRVRPTKGQHISFLLVFFFYSFFILFVPWLSAVQKRLGRFLRSIRQTTRSHARRCLLRVITLAKTFKGDMFPNPQNWAPNGDFQFKQKHE
jgi:hypothetical protein